MRFRRAVGAAELLEADDAEAALQDLRANPDVAYAEPEYVRQRSMSAVTPDDPLFTQQWALPMVNAQLAWSIATGSTAVTVAIIDTGVVDHAELQTRIIGGYDFISDATSAGDGDGRDADYSDPGSATDDSSGLHGTHVSGIVAALSNNDVGVAGLDWSCRLLIARVLGVERGQGADSDIADAIRWSAGLHVDGVPDNIHPAQVINMSFGGAGFSQTLQDAVTAAVNNGSIVVAAAGNNSGEARNIAPAGLTGVITVGAVDPSGRLASYSNYGSVLALLAPGGSPDIDPMTGQSQGVLSTMRLPDVGDTYAQLAGTSQATPFVAATISLMKAIYPKMSAADAKTLLQMSANGAAQCPDPNDPSQPGCGAGLLDVAAALTAATQAQAAGGIDSAFGKEVHGGCAYGAGGGEGAGGAAIAGVLAAWALGRARRRRVL